MYVYAENGVEVGRMETVEAAKLAYPLEYEFIHRHPQATYVKWNANGKESCLIYLADDGKYQAQYAAERGVKIVCNATEPAKTEQLAIKYTEAVEARREAARKRDAEEAAYDNCIEAQAEAYNLTQTGECGCTLLHIDLE